MSDGNSGKSKNAPHDPLDVELATSLGLTEKAIAQLMRDLGFRKDGQAFVWQGRRPRKGRGPHPARRRAKAPRPGNAFADALKDIGKDIGKDISKDRKR